MIASHRQFSLMNKAKINKSSNLAETHWLNEYTSLLKTH